MPFFKRKPKCPVTEDDRNFIESNFQWMANQFGPVTDHPIHLPGKLKIPADLKPEQLAEFLVDYCCIQMDLDPDSLELDFYFHGNARESMMGNVEFQDGYSLGEYHHRSHLTGKYVIHLNLAILDDLQKAMAVIAHELAHAKLIGEYRIRGDEEAHEYLTDLTVVYFGFGIFQANSRFQRRAYTNGDGMSGWSMETVGYLPLEMTCYALAYHAFQLGEQAPSWTKELSREPRRITRGAMAWLEMHGGPRRMA